MLVPPNQIIPYYPDLTTTDYIQSKNDFKTWFIYADLKNLMQGLYLKHVAHILSQPQERIIDTSIVSSVLTFIGFHIRLARKYNVKLGIVFFFESGKSMYHRSIHKEYKSNRNHDSFFGLDGDSKERFALLIQRNLQLIEKILVKCPNITVVHLKDMEADFIPYYLISRKIVPNNEKIAHITYSNDKDMFQNLALGENCFIFRRGSRIKEVLSYGEAMKRYVNSDFDKYSDEYFQLALAITGDDGDGVPGVKGVGPAYIRNNLNKIVTSKEHLNEIINKVTNDETCILNLDPRTFTNKKMHDIFDADQKGIIARNMKLVSYEVISRYFDKPKTIATLEMKEHISNMFRQKKEQFEVLYNVLARIGVEQLHEFAEIYSKK